MDNSSTFIVLTIFVAIAAIALLGQAAALIAMAVVVRRLQQKVMPLIPQAEAIIGVSRRTLENIEGHVEKIGATTNSVLESTKVQVAKIDELLTDATTRAKVQIERAEMVIDDTMGRAQETVSIVQRTVLRPIKEVHGVLNGIRTTLLHLSRGSRPTVDHATADEEMFI